MTIEEAIVQHLTDNAGVAGVVAGRIYPNYLPQNPTFPAIVFSRSSGQREHSHDGSSGLAHPSFVFDCFGADKGASKRTSDVVRLALDGFRGSMGGVSGVRVDAVFVEDEDDGWDDELQAHVHSIEFTVWHEE